MYAFATNWLPTIELPNFIEKLVTKKFRFRVEAKNWTLAMKLHLFTLLATVLAQTIFCPTAIAQSDANSKPVSVPTLRVLSYNIHHCEGVDGKLDLPRIAAVIDSVKPDIVALQEVDVRVKRSQIVDQAKELGKLTGLRHAFGANIDLQGGQYGNAVLAKGELRVVTNHRLPNIDQGEQRGVLEVFVKHDGRELRVLATHLDHRRDQRERLESVTVINQLATAQPNQPTLLIGDLNASFESEVLQRATQLWQLTNTNSMPTIPVAKPERQIDFVLTFPRGAWDVVDSRVLDEAIASDHRAILVELKLITARP